MKRWKDIRRDHTPSVEARIESTKAEILFQSSHVLIKPHYVFELANQPRYRVFVNLSTGR